MPRGKRQRESRPSTSTPPASATISGIQCPATHGGSVHSLLWGRDTSADAAAGFLHKVDADLLITGHVPCDAGFEVANPYQLILDSLGSPAAYCLFPATQPLTLGELAALVRFL